MGDLTVTPPATDRIGHTITTKDGSTYIIRASGEDGIRVQADAGPLVIMPHVSNTISIHARKGYDR